MTSENLCSITGSSTPEKHRVRLLKMGFFVLVMLFLGKNTIAQTLTIVNKSKNKVFYQVFGSVNSNCESKLSSVPASVEPKSKVVFNKLSEINWMGEKPGGNFAISSLKATFADPSGACNADASNYIGEGKCNFKDHASIPTSQCGGKFGNLNLVWTSKNGNVLVTIN